MMDEKMKDECVEMEKALQDIKVLSRDVEDFSESKDLKKKVRKFEKEIEATCEDDWFHQGEEHGRILRRWWLIFKM